MLVCVLKHTPGVFVDYLDESENETVYSGLEVEVSSKSHFFSIDNFVSKSLATFNVLDHSWYGTINQFYHRIL